MRPARRILPIQLTAIAGTAVHVSQLKRASHPGGGRNDGLGGVMRRLDDASGPTDLADPAHRYCSSALFLGPAPGNARVMATLISGPFAPCPGCWPADPSGGPSGR